MYQYSIWLPTELSVCTNIQFDPVSCIGYLSFIHELAMISTKRSEMGITITCYLLMKWNCYCYSSEVCIILNSPGAQIVMREFYHFVELSVHNVQIVILIKYNVSIYKIGILTAILISWLQWLVSPWYLSSSVPMYNLYLRTYWTIKL